MPHFRFVSADPTENALCDFENWVFPRNVPIEVGEDEADLRGGNLVARLRNMPTVFEEITNLDAADVVKPGKKGSKPAASKDDPTIDLDPFG